MSLVSITLLFHIFSLVTHDNKVPDCWKLPKISLRTLIFTSVFLNWFTYHIYSIFIICPLGNYGSCIGIKWPKFCVVVPFVILIQLLVLIHEECVYRYAGTKCNQIISTHSINILILASHLVVFSINIYLFSQADNIFEMGCKDLTGFGST